MDSYTTERWILDRHEAMIRTAEFRSRVATIPPRRLPMSLWLADSLRHLADRLDDQSAVHTDGQTRLESAPQ
jgi:hypothetical protein